MLGERLSIAVPGRGSGERLRRALEDLEPELDESAPNRLAVVLTLHAPDEDVVIGAVLKTVERWLSAEMLPATRVQVGDRPHTSVRQATVRDASSHGAR